MENQILKAHFLGCYAFNSKDKTRIFYKLQAVAYKEGTTKAVIIDTFVNENDYENLEEREQFSILELEVVPNFSTGSIAYKLH